MNFTGSIDVSLLEKIEAHSIHIAQEAGHILLEHFRRPLEVQFKGKQENDPVTIADQASEEYLKKAILEKFPEHCVLCEETEVMSNPDSPFVWVIDPLDGTTNFINGLPFFAVSIGVLWKWIPVAGSIYVPVSHRIMEGVYHARLGNGAFFEDERIEVSVKPSGRPLAEVPVQFKSRFHFSGKSRKEPYEARNLGSIALEITMVACGSFQYALFDSPRLWDVAAGVLLVKEAGGLVLTKNPKIRHWLQLEKFHLHDSTKRPENPRNWSLPLVVGAPDSARNIVNDMRINGGILSRIGIRSPQGHGGKGN